MSDRIQELTVFVRAAESGSFSAAGRELGLSQPSVSRILGELEARLGVKLLLRTTRRMTLTDAGSVFLERARALLAQWQEAEDAARGVDSLRGTLRLALPVIYGTRAVIPLLPRFLAAHPLLQLEMTVADERRDLVAEGADIAIRIGPLADSGFGAQRLPQLERCLVAAPSYLDARGTPANPAELIDHDCIFGPGSFGRAKWSFAQDGITSSVDVRGRIHTESGSGVLASVIAGLGIAIASPILCEAELSGGQLRQLLPGFTMEPADVHAVFPGGPRPSGKIRAFVAFLTDNLRVEH